MNLGSITTSMRPSFAGLEAVVWNLTGHALSGFANSRKEDTARREEIVMG